MNNTDVVVLYFKDYGAYDGGAVLQFLRPFSSVSEARTWIKRDVKNRERDSFAEYRYECYQWHEALDVISSPFAIYDVTTDNTVTKRGPYG